jgi:hypothetical protein
VIAEPLCGITDATACGDLDLEPLPTLRQNHHRAAHRCPTPRAARVEAMVMDRDGQNSPFVNMSR